MSRDIDEDLRREDIDARRRRARGTACQCGSDLPGSCPGPSFCPYAEPDDEPGEDDFDFRPHHRLTVVLDRTGSRFRD